MTDLFLNRSAACIHLGRYFPGENVDVLGKALALGCSRSDPVDLRLRLVD